MSGRDAFERILAAIYEAMLDDAHWPAASALIDEACGVRGNDLFVAEGPEDDRRGLFVGIYCRGQRREDLEREYLEHYFAIDEGVPRFRQLPDERSGPREGPVHGRGVEELARLQRGATAGALARTA